MTKINDLNTVDTLNGSDKLVVWSGETRAITASDAAQYFASEIPGLLTENYVNVKSFGATGDGVTNDAPAIQAAIAAANATENNTVYFPAGTYLINGQLIFHSGTTWIGDGMDKTVIQVSNLYGNNIAFRTNSTSSVVNVFDQTGIRLADIHFKGFDAVLTTIAGQTHAPLMRLWKIDGLIIERCKFSSHRYIMISLGGVKNFSITNCEFEDWGRTDDLAGSGTLPANEGGAAIWCGANPIDNTPTTFGTMRGNWLHDAEWSCVYLLGQYLNWSSNRIENIKEGDYARATDVAAASESRNITFVGNHYKTVTKRLIQATGFECGAKGVIIADNIFEGCVASAVDMSDTCEAAIVMGNYCLDCATSGDFAEYASITVRATTITADAVDGVTVTGNVVRSSAGNYGVRIYRVSGSDTFNNIRVADNDLVGAAADPADNLVFNSATFGTNVVIEGNNGAADYAPSLTWVPTVTASSGTLTTVTTPTAQYYRSGAMVFFTIAINVADNGTGSGALRFTLPTNPARAGACVGVNTSTGVGNTGSWGPNTTVSIFTATGAYPVVSGNILRLSGFYLEN